MKITYILPEITGGGIATYYKNLITPIVDTGNSVNIVLGDYKSDISNHDFPGNILQITENDYQEGWRKYIGLDIFPNIRHKCALSYACYKKAEKLNSDIIEITDYNLLFYSFLTNKIVPVVIRLAGSSGQLELHEHRDSDHIENILLLGIERYLINEADYIIGLSKLNIDYWNKLLSKKSFLHLPYLNYPNIDATDKKTEKCRGVVVGRLQLWKGAVFLCEFYKKYPSAPKVDWIGGDNYYKDHSKSMLSHLKKQYPDIIDNHINFKGRLSYEETQKAIENADFVLIPSTWDTFNFVITEAMWKEKVVIVSTGAGASELVQNDINGFVYKNNDLNSLMDAFNSYLKKTDHQLSDIAKNAHISIKNLLNNGQLITDRISVYKNLINQPVSKNHEIQFIDNSLQAVSTKEIFKRKLSIREIFQLILNKFSK
ncbi:glycosyltransferase family 4 protein [Pseudopedobacter beijingensis]|uniref:Glycosyltransferase family 4 protein n=1 Tax=Pseudopedobacter beijingensis TaxID=1207056 RepID=A0ABW4I8S3_9SPHI